MEKDVFEKSCIILLCNLLFFSKTLCYKYSSDDIPVFRNPPKDMKTIWHKIYYWVEGSYRSGPQVDHALSMLIHSINCVLVYLAFGANDISFIAAILFMLNPINNQGSIWISGRSYALATLGLLGAMAFPYVSPLFLTLATYYNAGFIAPLMFLAYNHWITLAGLMGWTINIKRFRTNVKHKISQEMFYEDKSIKPEKIVLAVKTFGYYTTLALIPFKITFYHAFLQSCAGSGKDKAYTIKCRFFWIGIIYIIGIISYCLLTKWSLISFGLLWWCFTLAPFCNLFRMSQEIAERYCYLPLAGLSFVVATVLSGHPLLLGIVVGAYAVKLWHYADAYTDDYHLIETACLNSPDSWFAWHIRAMCRWERKSYQEAVILWTMARMLSPKEFKLNFNIASALKMSRNDKEAEYFIEQAAQNIPVGQEETANGHLNRWKSGQWDILL